MTVLRITTLIVIFSGFCMIGYVQAQPGSNPGGGGKPGVPITGVEWIVGAGALLGARKLYLNRKRSSN